MQSLPKSLTDYRELSIKSRGPCNVTFICRAGTPGPDGIQLMRAVSITSKILKVPKDILLLAERPKSTETQKGDTRPTFSCSCCPVLHWSLYSTHKFLQGPWIKTLRWEIQTESGHQKYHGLLQVVLLLTHTVYSIKHCKQVQTFPI